ncbi:MAG: rhodanese-like domain-containing protein [Acidimicrobiia bacterium]
MAEGRAAIGCGKRMMGRLTLFARSRTRLAMLLMAAVAAATALAGCGGSDSAAMLETVPSEEAAAYLNGNPDAVVLDIRTPEEFSEGIIEGAVNIDFYEADFATQLDQLDKDASYVVYCRSGNRSGQSMNTFEDLGFTQVTEIDGGIVDWYASGYPVVAP